MSGRVAKFTQADYHRIFKAAEKAGLNVRIERPNGTIITTTGKSEENGNGNGALDKWMTEKQKSSRSA